MLHPFQQNGCPALSPFPLGSTSGLEMACVKLISGDSKENRESVFPPTLEVFNVTHVQYTVYQLEMGHIIAHPLIRILCIPFPEKDYLKHNDVVGSPRCDQCVLYSLICIKNKAVELGMWLSGGTLINPQPRIKIKK